MSNIKERRGRGGSDSSSSDLERSGSSVKRNKREEMEVEEDDGAETTKTTQGLLKSFYYNFVPEPGTEGHRMQMGTASWLRAGVLGANVGVAANQNSSQGAILVAGLSGLVAGACSMAVGEYVSVSSQRDLEHADLKKEEWEIENNWDGELEELTVLYEERGCDRETAKAVATQLMAKDALRAHAMEELGIRDFTKARPFQAGIVSFLMFLIFGSIPFLSCIFIPNRWALIGVCVGVTLFLLALCGAVGAYFGGASMWKGALRVAVGGFGAMAITAGIGIATDYSSADTIDF